LPPDFDALPKINGLETQDRVIKWMGGETK
jgi:hypothetical protein